MNFDLYKKTAASTAVALLVALPALASAANSPENRYFSNRFYLGAGVGVSELEPRKTTDSLSITDKKDTSFSLHAGYDLSPRFTLDGYASSLGEAEVSFIGTPVGGVDYTVYGLSLISYLFNAGSANSNAYDDDGLYQREGLSTYLRLGVGGMTNDSDKVDYHRDYSTHFATGLGLEYGWSNGVAVRAELSSYDTDARQVSISALKRLGDASYANAAAPAAIAAALPVAAIAAEAVAPAAAEEPVLGKPIVLFAFDQIKVKPDYFAELDRLVEIMNDYPEVNILVDGYTDWIGDGTYNQMLSERRAFSVSGYLKDKGISEERINVTGHGELNPIADNNTFEGRTLNRRVEISRQP